MGSHRIHLSLVLFAWATLSCLSSGVYTENSVLSRDFGNHPSEARVAEMFQRWMVKHKKAYSHVAEAEARFENFKRNVKYVAEKSEERIGHEVGLNRFADMSNEEFRRVYTSRVRKPAKKRSVRGRRVESCTDAPGSLDWRKKGAVTAVKDQGSCGSCWSFSSTGAMEGVNAIVTGDLVSLSEQELVDCDSTNDGCDGGYMDYAFEWVISNGGIDSESDYPYTGVSGSCNTTKEERKVVSIDGYKDVGESDSDLLCAAVQQPVSVGIDGSAWDFQLYTGGIYDGECSSDPDDIDHAVLVVGYGSEGDDDYWIVKNSWGTSWGMDGYIYIKRNTNLTYGVCAINAMASYPTKETSAPSPSGSPSPPPPPPPPPTPSPPPPSPPPPSPPPPSPSPSKCGDFSYCQSDETCCCTFEFLGFCLTYGCCEYESAVCCTGTEYCCPADYPICDVEDGLCLKNQGDYLGVAAKKRKPAQHKLPWSVAEKTEKTYHPLQWKRNPLAAEMR